MRFLEVIIQAASIRPHILDIETLGVELCFGGEYLNVSQSDIFQNSLYVEIQTITNNGQAEAFFPTVSYQFVKPRSYSYRAGGNFEQAFSVSFDHSKSVGIKA